MRHLKRNVLIALLTIFGICDPLYKAVVKNCPKFVGLPILEGGAKEVPNLTSLTCDDAANSGRDLVNDNLSIDWATPRNTQDVTGADKTGMERLLLLGDFSVTLVHAFNDATNKTHDVFKTVCSSSVLRAIVIVLSGDTLTNTCALKDYRHSRGADGSYRITVPAELSSGTAPTWS